MSDLIHITSKEQFQTEITEFEGVVVVDFYADRCGPCVMLGPIMEELKSDNADKAVKIVKIDVDNPGNQETAMKFGISSIPAVYLFYNGEAKEGVIGVNGKHVYQEKVDALLG